MGGDKSGDYVQMGTSTVGAIAGGYFGGPQGAKLGWDIGGAVGGMANKTTGMESGGDGLASKGLKMGNTASTAYGGASMASGAMGAGTSGTVTGAKGGTYDTVTNKSGTFLTPDSLSKANSANGLTGAANPTIPTENGYGKLGDIIGKAMDTAGSVMKSPDSGVNGLQPMQMQMPNQMAAPMNLSQVLAAQLMNPASQNRLAFQHPGRM